MIYVSRRSSDLDNRFNNCKELLKNNNTKGIMASATQKDFI